MTVNKQQLLVPQHGFFPFRLGSTPEPGQREGGPEPGMRLALRSERSALVACRIKVSPA
jgi:hypothetical protein